MTGEHHAQNSSTGRLSGMLPAALVLLISLGITFAGWRYELKRTDEASYVRFFEATKSVENDIIATMRAYAQFLRGGVGLFHAAEDVTRDDWRRYVADLALGETSPGIQGISFNAVLHNDAERSAFQAQVRSSDRPDFTMRPPTDFPLSVPIVYIEPMTARNAPAIGFDIYSEDRRRAAIDRAIFTGQINMTAKIMLIQENDQDVQAGVLLMLPIFDSGDVPATPDARISEAKGMIVSIFRLGNLMQHVMERHTRDFADEIAIVLSDGPASADDNVLFASHTNLKDAAQNAQHTYADQFDMFGQVWTLTAASTASYEARIRQSSPAIVLGLGIIVSLLLTALAWAQGLRTQASEAAAHKAKQNERHVALLLHEVNHRAKNMLSVINAIARQTALNDPATFTASFAKRIKSLAASHDLLVANAWKGIMLDELVTSQLAHFKQLLDDRITMQGPSVKLHATAAQNIGMALHELSTNAAKYGALSQETGKISVAWDVTQDADDVAQFTLSWTETDGPAVTPPVRKGFGTVVLGAMVRSNLKAEVAMDYAAQGIVWRMSCPLSACAEPDPKL